MPEEHAVLDWRLRFHGRPGAVHVLIRLFSAVLLLPGIAVQEPSAPAPAPARAPAERTGAWFEDVTARAGLAAAHLSSPEKRYIIESMSGGIGLFDCDNDGRLDIVMVNGSSVERYRAGGDPLVTLWRQTGDLEFADATRAAGLTARGWGMGVAVADFDNDGWLDLYVTGYGGNALYRNRGGCTFEDVTGRAGLRVGGFSAGAAWGDFDRDGRVDLFVARYVRVDMDNLPEFGRDRFCRYKGILVQCGPWGLPGESDFLFRNRGDGTFEDVTEKAGVGDPAEHYGLGVLWGDIDNDGWLDLYVANDAGPNYLYRNNRDGTFEEIGLVAGAALSGEAVELGSMGVDFGDYLREGRFGIVATNFAEQANSLYRNLGPQGFADVAWPSKIGQPGFALVGWGTAFFDYDHDGWPDLFIANGHVYPQVDALAAGARYRQPLLLHRNRGDGTFDDVTDAAGLAALPLASRRGAAFGDVNNDGVMDVVLLNVGEPPTLLLGRVANDFHRVWFELRGTRGNRAAIGARVTVRAGDAMWMNEVRGGASYLSQNDLRLHFGLGRAAVADTVEVRWPDGSTQRFEKLAADRLYRITEGAGLELVRDFPRSARP